MKIYILRHGKTKVIDEDYFRSHLSSEGEIEAQELAKNEIFRNIDKIFSSTFNRAVDTAKVFAVELKLPINLDKRLNEWKLQSMNHPDYLEEERKGWEDVNRKGVSGESILDLRKRFLEFLEELSKVNSEKDILLVTHGTAIESIVSYLENRDPSIENIKTQKYLKVVELNVDKGKIELLRTDI